MEERRIRERRRRKVKERGRREAGARMIGIEEVRKGWFLAMRVQEILIPAGEEEDRWIGGV